MMQWPPLVMWGIRSGCPLFLLFYTWKYFLECSAMLSEHSMLFHNSKPELGPIIAISHISNETLSLCLIAGTELLPITYELRPGDRSGTHAKQFRLSLALASVSTLCIIHKSSLVS